MLLLFISLYLLSNVAVGAWAARRVTTSQDFVLAGRRLPLMLAASVTFATWFGSETIMGAPAMFVEGGFLAVIEEPFGSSLCLFLVGLSLPGRSIGSTLRPSAIIFVFDLAGRPSCCRRLWLFRPTLAGFQPNW